MWGLSLEEASDRVNETLDVWPDNVRAVNVFIALSTQWRVGFGGAYGLDFNVLYRKMDRLALSPDDCEDLEAEIRVLEDAALETMRKSQPK